ncbi:MAG TPA: 30S ribosomal protein S8e [Candidatus Nanoarchaeia archaeon]|nr:30S ribosomal protein S8e [Candidatus Nanoarchaeia archaeon]
MVVIHGRAKRKPSGGRYTSCHPKRLHQKGNLPTHTRIDKQDARNSKTKGGGLKTRLLAADKVNLFDPETRKHSIETIKTVVENPANRHYVRRNIITKGTVIDTSKGKARVTNRPGQEGMVNAVLIK